MPRYRNLDGTTPDKGFGDLWRWQVKDRLAGRRSSPGVFATPRRENDGAALADTGSASLTWIGHSTFVQRLAGKLIATDPIWSPRVGTFRRNVAPGVALEDVPALDVVTVSHAHYDHMDMPTLKRIGGANPGATFVVPKDNADVLRAGGITNVVELAWWESHVVDGVRITLVPAQHWSIRMPWDRNRRLWGGFVYESEDATTYHAGDTAFSEQVFREIAARFPKIDYAMIPIGAYEPTWFMESQHIGPEDAGKAWEILGAKTFVAMHWGTFSLTDEPLGEPPERLRAWFASRGHAAERGWILDVGETRAL